MKAILTSSLGGSRKENGKRIPTILNTENGMLDRLKPIWIQNARVLMICADPLNDKKNDSLCACMKDSFPMSGFGISSLDICDGRNMGMIERINNYDVLILTGGHVPTQNVFMKQLCLNERLSEFDGIVVAWSAGSMNCAETVYASPELEGEAIDPHYERWIPGLGITNISIFPHFQSLKDDYLDGLRVIEDIAFADSMGHEFVALNDGSYILIDDGHETLYGEAYRIKDGLISQICKNNKSAVLK